MIDNTQPHLRGVIFHRLTVYTFIYDEVFSS